MIDPNHVLKVGAATDLYVGQLRARNAELEKELQLARFSNAVTYGTSHPEMYKTELDEYKELVAELEKEVERLKVINSELSQAHNRAIVREARPEEQIAELRQQLAISQLEAKRLREALEEFVNGADECLDDGGWVAMVVSMEAYHICDEAISSPTSTEALDAYVAEKVKSARVIDEKQIAYLFEERSALIKQRDLAVSELETIATGFDCDNDAHRYGTYCRKCEAEKALAAIKESESPNKP